MSYQYQEILSKAQCIQVSENLRIYKANITNLYGFQKQQDLPSYVQVASIKRQKEFIAGRLLCQAILFKHGEVRTITSAVDRLPQWPPLYMGSISHTNEDVVVAIEKKSHYLGIDLEKYLVETCLNEIKDLVITPSELSFYKRLCQRFDERQVLTLFFSLKESLYKAIYPKVKKYVDFLDVFLIDINLKQSNFLIRVEETIQHQASLETAYCGGWLFLEDQVITWVYQQGVNVHAELDEI